MTERIRDEVREYYESKLRLHGRTAAGVDWNSEQSQTLRFRQFERLWEDDPHAGILDYGCGYGALASHVRSRRHGGAYVGFDVSEAMVTAGRAHTASLPGCTFTSQRPELAPADYAVASGILNVKQGTSLEAWTHYAEETVADLAALGLRGFAFNALSSDAAPDRRRSDLYYAEPTYWFDYCRRTYSRRVALLHDYPLWEFTILVRHDRS